MFKTGEGFSVLLFLIHRNDGRLNVNRLNNENGLNQFKIIHFYIS